MAISLTLFWLIPAGYPVLDSIAMFMVGFAIFGPQMLIGVAAAELSHKKAAATSTGFIGCFAYMGAASAGYPFGRMVDLLGWEGLFFGMGACAILATVFLSPMWHVTRGERHLPATQSQPELA
jgi:OPA family sugar phosphate sensor protein UhpC-like MFS transporter